MQGCVRELENAAGQSALSKVLQLHSTQPHLQHSWQRKLIQVFRERINTGSGFF